MNNIDFPQFFRLVAEAAREASLPHFRVDTAIENKQHGGFDPVTVADRGVETVIRALLAEHFPEDGIVGEEYGSERSGAARQWIIDPIDGTRAFISGVPVWGTLVGLTVDGDAVAGMMAQPYIGELLYGVRDQGAFFERGDVRRTLKTRMTTAIGEAIAFTTTPELYTGASAGLPAHLRRSTKLLRYGTDCYAFAMIAAGQVDLVLDPGLKPYDIVGLIPLIEAAGGVVTTWDGGSAEQGGDIVASANPALHEQALALIASSLRGA
jgi:histidinol phosphatase-like enzyme (inositol monophosphatase family)